MRWSGLDQTNSRNMGCGFIEPGHRGVVGLETTLKSALGFASPPQRKKCVRQDSNLRAFRHMYLRHAS